MFLGIDRVKSYPIPASLPKSPFTMPFAVVCFGGSSSLTQRPAQAVHEELSNSSHGGEGGGKGEVGGGDEGW